MILPIFLISITINAMEVEKICHLALLPTEIQNHIASYLPCNTIVESDDEFIDRTRILGPISKEHRHLIENHKNNIEFPDMETGSSSYGTLSIYSVDCSKIINLEKLADEPKATIFDIHSETMRESKCLAEQSKKNISTLMLIALSRTGRHYAQWQVHARYNHWKNPYQENRLIIKNTFSGEVEFIRYLIADQHKDLISMGFNKQGTKIIIHAKEDCLWEHGTTQREMSYRIFSLTSPEEHEEKSKKTLEAYLRYIGCCKNLAKNHKS